MVGLLKGILNWVIFVWKGLSVTNVNEFVHQSCNYAVNSPSIEQYLIDDWSFNQLSIDQQLILRPLQNSCIDKKIKYFINTPGLI